MNTFVPHMKIKIELIRRIGLHLLFWVTYIAIAVFVYSVLFRSNALSILQQTLRILPYILATTYLILYVFIPNFLNRKKILLFAISFFAIPFIISIIYRYFYIQNYLESHPEYIDQIPFFSIPYLIFSFENFSVMSFAAIIKIMKHWYYTQHRKLLLEKQNLQNELDVLQYQINPHFLFNILNNLYSLAIENNDEPVANGIVKLSGLMRYNIYTKKNTKVPLTDEIQYLNNYIKLQEIRFGGSYNLQVNFDVKGEIEGKEISPFIFIMFVENAFKFGISLGKESVINIKLEAFSDRITFVISNFKYQAKNGIGSGIGLENVRRRLDHYYPLKHELLLDNELNIFNVFLKIYVN
jgi:two-component system, LytTR family, sensor kinase